MLCLTVWDVASIGQYVALRALDVGWDLCGTQRWYQLYKLLYSMRSSNFCELVLRFDATQDLNSIIDLDALLASPIDNYLTRSFPRLQRVCIIIRADANTLPWTKRGQVGCAVRRWMSRLDALGKLQVEFDYVGKVCAY